MRDKLLAAFDHIKPIEQSMVVEFAERLGVGQAQYGPFKEHDSRNFAQETWEETADALVYSMRKLGQMK